MALIRLHSWAGLTEQMRAHIVILDQSRGKHRSRSIVGSIFTFLVSNIHYSVLLVPVTVQLTTVFN